MLFRSNTYAYQLGGRTASGSNTFFDGYLSEVNFIDGYAYDPSYFGYTDPTTGVWMPKKYSGASYGTNGFYLPFLLSSSSSYAASFNGTNQSLQTATNAGLGLGTSDFTVEYWLNSSVTTGSVIPLTAGKDRKSTRLNSSHTDISRMPSSA